MATNSDISALFQADGDSPLPDRGNGAAILAFGIDDTIVSEAAASLNITVIEPFRPAFNKLQQAGISVLPQLDDESGFDGVYIQAGKHKARNHIWILQALRRVIPRGRIIITGAKTSGIDSLRRWCADLAEIQGQFSKGHGKTFWFERPETIDDARLAALTPAPQRLEDRFTTFPGTFSYRQIDKGSALLASLFDGRIKGHVADFGAGWGYLSALTLDKSDKIKSLDLYEADIHAIQAAELNLQDESKRLPIHFYWHDIVGEDITQTYDTILCNPPFHEGRASDVSLGQAFIRKASNTLRRGGVLYLVANRQLPYESVLKTQFFKVETLAEKDGFKIIAALK